MLGVTTYVTTDIVSAPFLWVAPLALYLLTFIIAFQAKPAIRPQFALTVQAVSLSGLRPVHPPVWPGLARRPPESASS